MSVFSFTRLFDSLGKTRMAISAAINGLSGTRETSENIDEIEAVLIGADIGTETTDEVIRTLKEHRSEKNIKVRLAELLLAVVSNASDSSLLTGNCSTVFLIVGVNGAGKTTSAVKLAYYLKQTGSSVLLVCADTYRAAAIQQLEKWSVMAQTRLIRNPDTRDPSSVIFDGLVAARSGNYRFLVVDTAGRLHTYKNLMVEVAKMYRIVNTKFPDFRIVTYLTLDANLGQNSLVQCREFNRHIPVDGIILTKMDGTAKGGIVFPIYREMGIPVKFLGVGESLEDLVEFDPVEYVSSLIELNSEQKDSLSH